MWTTSPLAARHHVIQFREADEGLIHLANHIYYTTKNLVCRARSCRCGAGLQDVTAIWQHRAVGYELEFTADLINRAVDGIRIDDCAGAIGARRMKRICQATTNRGFSPCRS